MVSSPLCFTLLGLGASLVSAIPKANYLIPHPPATVTLTTCGSQCASTVTVTETFTETAPYFYTCEPTSTSVPIATLSSVALSSSILPHPLPTPTSYTNSTTRAEPSTSSQVAGITPTLNLSSSINPPAETLTPGLTVSSQLPSAGTPSSSHTWGVNSTLSHSRSSSSSYGTGTAGTGVSSGRPYPSSSRWSNTTRPITYTITRTIRTTDTDSFTIPRVTVPTIPIISIPPPPSTSTESESAISSGLSYTVTTYTTVSIINTTVSSQLPGASTLSHSASRTTMRTTIIVTITNTVPLSTGTGYISNSRGTGVSSGFPSPSLSRSIRLSNSLSYGTTTTSDWPNATSTSIVNSIESTFFTRAATKASTSSSRLKVPCATDTVSPSEPSPTTGTTVFSALPSLVIPTGSVTLGTITGEYGYPPNSSLGTTVGSAKPSLVSSSTSEIPGGYESEYPTSLLGTTISSALSSSVTPSISTIPGAYEFPLASEDLTSTEHPGTTVASALPSLVMPSSSEASSTPTTLETRKSGEYTSTSVAYTGYNYGPGGGL